ncbi:MAG: LacI family DNA-binding transcriptional regulator [Ferruginibacter sp.]
MQQNSTLKKLSEILHISVSTVSRALRNHPDISEETKKRVKDLATKLDYEPNSFAIHLRNKTSNLLGILVPSVDNYFYDSFISAVEKEARLMNYTVLIMQSGESKEAEAANLKVMKNNHIAGVFVSITTETDNIDHFLKLQDNNIPVLFFDRVPDFNQCNKICLADREAAKIAAEAIIAKDKKTVLALFGHKNLTISQKRYQSFNEVFEAASPLTKIINEFPLNLEEAKAMTGNALDQEQRPDTIFCMGDLILIGAMQAIYERGLKVPEDIAVISISNGFIPTLYNPKITYVETSGYKLGQLAFKRMMKCLAGYSFLQELTVDSLLVDGGSL